MDSTMMDCPLALPSLLRRIGTLYADVEVVSRRPDRSMHRYTYGDFHRRATALAGALQQLGLRTGERVATLMWNHHAHLEAYYAIPCAGGVVHTLNLRLAPAELAFVINHAGDRFLIVDDVLLPLFEQVRASVQIEKVMVVHWQAGGSGGGVDFEDLLRQEAPFRAPAIDERAPLGMCYTSGTTGRPKAVVYSHRSVLLHSMVACMPLAIGIAQHDVVLPVVPMFHVNAWGLPFAAPMTGAKLVLPGPHLDAASILELWEGEKVTISAGVPTVWFNVLQALDAGAGRRRQPGMRVFVGGAAAPESVIRRFAAYDINILHAWGMTETSPIATVSHPKSTLADDEDSRFAVRSRQGTPMPFVEVRAMNEQGEVPWDGQTMGELHVRGPWITGSYYAPMEPATNFTADGWLQTGDIVTIDPHGYVKITDRAKDLIKSGGEWISSVELESALVAHPDVAEAAVIAVPHPKWDERPLAVVVLKPARSATAESLLAFLAPNFAKFRLPDDVAFVSALPKTATGKLLKAVLREQFKARCAVVG